MATKISHLIFLDSLFAPVYKVCSWVLPFFSKASKNDKIIAIKFFGIGSIVRVMSVLKDAEYHPTNIELITLNKNKKVCQLLEIKAHYIRSENLFLMLSDLVSIMFMVWRMKKVKILDLERISNLSGIFRLMCSIGKSCASFTFDTKNSEIRNQTFISLKNKAAIHAISEIFQVKKRSNFQPKDIYKTNKIVININAGEYLPQRKYPIKYFAEIIDNLHQENDSFRFVLTGSNKEIDYTLHLAKLLDKLRIPYENAAGELSLTELSELLKSSQMLITNDSGPLHLAYYYEVPTVAIWGPTSAKLVGYPDSYRMKNVSIEKVCSPCFIHPKSKVALACSNKIDCLQELDSNKVINAVLELCQPLSKLKENVE